MQIFNKKLQFPDDLFGEQAVIIKRNIVYLYSVFIYLIFFIILISVLFYQSVTLDYINILIIFIFNFSFFFWLYLIVKYILKYIKIYRPYFFYKESNVLIQNRKYFRKFANITFVIFILNIIFLLTEFLI